MILIHNDYDIPNFLSALGFIAPKGYDVDYFITTDDVENTTVQSIIDNGYIEEVDPAYKGIRYMRKDPKLSHSFPDTHFSPSIDATQIQEYPRTIPKINTVTNNPELLHTITVKSPVHGIQILENTKDEATIMLKENMYGLPKNTLVHIIKEK